MGNNCLQSNQTINQKEKVIHINCNPNLKRPSKQILHPSIQNLSQNLDTFEEDFYKNEFFFDFKDDNMTKIYSNKSKEEKAIMNDVQLNILQCPSLNYVDELQIPNKNNSIINKVDLLNFAFIKEPKKKEKTSFKKSKKPVQQKFQLKSILKQNNSKPSSFSSLSDRSGKYSVSFNLVSNKNSKNSRSLSPILITKSNIKQKTHTKSMIFMQQFPYL